MNKLNVEPNWSDADRFYAALTDAHRHLDAAASQALNARLILILANQIGDCDILLEALAVAANPDAAPEPD